MDNIMIKIIELAVLIVITIISRYLIPFVKSKLDGEKLSLITKYATIFVQGIEYTIKNQGQGQIKKNEVMRLLTEQCNKIGIKLTEEQLSLVVEQAVSLMNKEINKSN